MYAKIYAPNGDLLDFSAEGGKLLAVTKDGKTLEFVPVGQIRDSVDASSWRIYAANGDLIFEYVPNGAPGAAGIKARLTRDGVFLANDVGTFT